MTDLSFEEHHDEADPLDAVELVLSSEQRPFERADDEVHFAAQTQYCDLHGAFTWRSELPALMFTLAFEMKAPRNRRADIALLITLLNETLWLGHFDLWSEDGAVVYRCALPCIGRDAPEAGEVAAMLAAGLQAAERFYPAFNFLLWAGKSAEDAAQAVLFETAGEA